MRHTQLLKAIDSTSQHLLGRAAAAVNQALVIRNWLVGAYIVEFEQHGEDRAKYGEGLLRRLSEDLIHTVGKGFGVSQLCAMVQFYRTYPGIGSAILQSAIGQSLLARAPANLQSVIGEFGIRQLPAAATANLAASPAQEPRERFRVTPTGGFLWAGRKR